MTRAATRFWLQLLLYHAFRTTTSQSHLLSYYSEPPSSSHVWISCMVCRLYFPQKSYPPFIYPWIHLSMHSSIPLPTIHCPKHPTNHPSTHPSFHLIYAHWTFLLGTIRFPKCSPWASSITWELIEMHILGLTLDLQNLKTEQQSVFQQVVQVRGGMLKFEDHGSRETLSHLCQLHPLITQELFCASHLPACFLKNSYFGGNTIHTPYN